VVLNVRGLVGFAVVMVVVETWVVAAVINEVVPEEEVMFEIASLGLEFSILDSSTVAVVVVVVVVDDDAPDVVFVVAGAAGVDSADNDD
jgi:hypothetical protein